MLVLGIVLIAAAAGVSIDLVLKNTSTMDVSAFGQSFSTSPGWLFVAGLAAGVVGVLGVLLVGAGMAGARKRRAALKDLRQTHGSAEQLQAERDRLAAELEAERRRHAETVDVTDVTDVTGGPGAPDTGAQTPHITRR
jgi:hypothetical protein